jgi:non-homologous end joining protein Ku
MVPREDTARGHEVGKNRISLSSTEFEAIQIESTRTIDIDQFVARNEIDKRCIDSPYYIAANQKERH